jgi:hypothetical protein
MMSAFGNALRDKMNELSVAQDSLLEAVEMMAKDFGRLGLNGATVVADSVLARHRKYRKDGQS